MTDNMPSRDALSKPALWLFLASAGLFVAGRYLGVLLFDNNWGFVQWRYLPVWYGPAWILFCAGLLHVVYHHSETVARTVAARWFVPVGSVVAAAAALFLSYDSFVCSGGNLLVSGLAQMETLVIRGSEPLTTLLVVALREITSLFTSKPHIAAWYAWRIFSYLFAALAVWGAISLSRRLVSDSLHRLWIAITLLLGGQTLVLLGFVGLEVTVVAATIWFALLAIRAMERRSSVDLLMVWVVTALAVGFYVGNLFIVPATVAVSYLTLTRRPSGIVAGVVAALTGLLVLVGLYYTAGRSFPLSRVLMFMTGKNPFGDYGAFSLRHLGDFVQTALLAAPLGLAAIGLMFTKDRGRGNTNLVALVLMLGGLAALFVSDPVNGAPLDFPRLAAYLAPAAVLLVVMAASLSPKMVGMLAVVALATPLAYVPVYNSIERTSEYISPYCDRHQALYRDACLAFRDAYFARGEFSKADEWERLLPLKSPEVINLRGITSLSMQGETEEALRVLYPVIARFPYWSEPRDLAARIQIRVGRFQLARPQIDTLLLIDPYDKQALTLLYEFFRDSQNMPEALAQATYMHHLYPHDKNVATDFMVANYRAGEYAEADSIASGLLAADSTMGYPHLILGLIAERNGQKDKAIGHYRRFTTFSPDAPEVATAKKRLAQLEGNVSPAP